MPHSFTWNLPDRILTIGSRPLVMGIVNVTPDSFSDGGLYFDHDTAINHAIRLVEDGADILDIGGESTRPGAERVSEQDELNRVIPVISELSKRVKIPISIDTSKARIAAAAVEAGATIINDVTGLDGDPDLVSVAHETRAALIVMHMKGSPRTMQIDPVYDDVVQDVKTYLRGRLDQLASAGIAPSAICIDPGIGFGKTFNHNMELLGNLDAFLDLERPICLGVSRKGFIRKALGREGKVEPGPGGTIGVLLNALVRGGVHVARVHDVAPVRDAIEMFVACRAG